ncbi:MAG: hypothetical protein ACI9ON_002635 [Limisphaerales bacterium]|jgi:uncharacterized protein YhdP
MSTRRELGRLERYLLRPLFLFISFVLVLLALFQGGGRLTFALVHLFSEEIDLVAQTFDVRIRGVDGDWAGLNPILKANQVVFAGGYAQNSVVEFDVLESIWRSEWVFRRINSEKIYLDVVRDQQGWHLRGRPVGQPMPDVLGTLQESDEMQATVELKLTNSVGVQSSVESFVRLANHSDRHFAQLTMITGPGASLRFEGWQSRGIEPARTEVIVNGKVIVPEALGGPSLMVEVVEGGWSGSLDSGQGILDLIAQASMPVPSMPPASSTSEGGLQVQVEFDVQLQARDGLLSGLVDRLELVGQRASLHLEESRFSIDSTGVGDNPMVRLWQSELDLGRINQFLTAEFGVEHPVGEWTNGANIRGRAHNVHGYFDPKLGWGYGATLAEVAMRGHRGAPGLTAAQGRLWGHGRGVAVSINGEDLTLNFPALFTDTWPLSYLQGQVKAWFRDGYFGLRGENLKGQIGESAVAGKFSLTRPTDLDEQRVALALWVDQADMQSVRSFIPYKIPPNHTQWLSNGPVEGNVSNARFAYQGQVRPVDESMRHRRIELAAQLTDGVVRFEPNWPLVEALTGAFHVSGQDIQVTASQATSLGVQLADAVVVLHDNAAYAEVTLYATGDSQKFLDYVLQSPLQENLGFITPGWQGNGQLALDGNLIVPIRREDAPDLSVDLNLALEQVELEMPQFRTHFFDLSGRGTFSLPHNLQGEFSGQLFDRPAVLDASYDEDWMTFAIDGAITDENAYRMAALDDLGVMVGEFSFQSSLNVAMRSQLITNLELTTDLTNLEVLLPGQFSKLSEEANATELDVQFLSDYQSIRWRYKETEGWLHYSDQIDRGAIGLNVTPPMADQNLGAILIGGSLEQLTLSDWVSGQGKASVAIPKDWIIQSLKIDEFVIDDLLFNDLTLTGKQTGADVEFGLHSADLTGVIRLPDQQVVDIDIEHIRLPQINQEETSAEAGFAIRVEDDDPIGLEVGYNLPAAKVDIARLDLGAEAFGAWRFVIEPQEGGVQFSDFGADVNGIHIEHADMYWDLATNQSHFQGRIGLDNLENTLPLWDYAAALQTDEASLVVDSSWAGSPANASLIGLNGELSLRVRNGRFLDVESGGGLRVLSLLNFANIAKRINFDFSDVTKEGMEFDKLDARVDVKDGQLRFLDRMQVESKSSNFEIGGQVDLRSGILNNEMIVTLPVSDSLPWYGVYLALANPLAGLGVLVGERVLRKPLRAFSTAKFEVKGTLDEPEVNFVGLWDRSMRENGRGNDDENERVKKDEHESEREGTSVGAPLQDQENEQEKEPENEHEKLPLGGGL